MYTTTGSSCPNLKALYSLVTAPTGRQPILMRRATHDHARQFQHKSVSNMPFIESTNLSKEGSVQSTKNKFLHKSVIHITGLPK